MEPVPARTAGAVAAGAVARQVDERVPAVRGLAAPQPLLLARHDDEGQRHAAVGREMVGDRGVRGEVVHVPVVAVVVRELRGGPGRRDEPVDQVGGDAGVGRREDLGEAGPDVAHGAEVLLAEGADPADEMALREGVQRGDVGETVLGPARVSVAGVVPRRLALRCGVHQIDHRVEGDPGVVRDQHASLPGLPAGGRLPMAADSTGSAGRCRARCGPGGERNGPLRRRGGERAGAVVAVDSATTAPVSALCGCQHDAVAPSRTA
uniref:Uncharacterized protein n=1 Tax=Kitasatospora aureofaciens TaxID=1894 RepID=Q8GFE8_KITAU|nr:unknown [Kitasatospora aureofaciens]